MGSYLDQSSKESEVAIASADLTSQVKQMETLSISPPLTAEKDASQASNDESIQGFPTVSEKASLEKEASLGLPVDDTPSKNQIITYAELVRINEKKEYGDLSKNELEEYLSDIEFKTLFKMTKVCIIIMQCKIIEISY